MRKTPLAHPPLLVLMVLVGSGCQEAPDTVLPDGQVADRGPGDAAPGERSTDSGGPADAVQVPDARPLITAVLWRGFGFAWDKTSHRTNKLGAFVSGQPAASSLTMVATAIMEGGSWASGQSGTDSAAYEVGYSAIRTRAARFVEGTFADLTVQGDATSTPEVIAQTSRSERISLAKAGLADAKTLVLLLRGFSFDTDLTHTDGYTTRGFSVTLSGTKREGQDVVTTVGVRVHAGTVVDRIQNLESYGATVRVGYTLVALDRGHQVPASVSYSLSLAAGVNPVHPHAAEALASQTLLGKPGLDQALVGLTSFELWINKSATLFPARYLRSVRVMNEKITCSTKDGKVSLWTDGYFSNSSLVTYATAVDFLASVVALQLEDPGSAVVHGTVSGKASQTTTTVTQGLSF